ADARRRGKRLHRRGAALDVPRSRGGIRDRRTRRPHRRGRAAAQPPRPGVLRAAPGRRHRRAVPRRRRAGLVPGATAAARLARRARGRLSHQPQLGFHREHVWAIHARPGTQGTILKLAEPVRPYLLVLLPPSATILLPNAAATI